MIKLITFFMTLFTMSFATSDVSELFDLYLKDMINNVPLADGSLETTYFNIPHRTAPSLIEPFILATRPTAEQIIVSNIRRLVPVNKESRYQQVWDGEGFDYDVMSTAISMDIAVNSLPGDLKSMVPDIRKGRYVLNGRVSNLVMNVTMQTLYQDYRVIPQRDNIIPTNVDLTVTGDDQERTTVELRSTEIIGGLVTSLFYKAFREFNSNAGKALEQAVRSSLGN